MDEVVLSSAVERYKSPRERLKALKYANVYMAQAQSSLGRAISQLEKLQDAPLPNATRPAERTAIIHSLSELTRILAYDCEMLANEVGAP